MVGYFNVKIHDEIFCALEWLKKSLTRNNFAAVLYSGLPQVFSFTEVWM